MSHVAYASPLVLEPGISRYLKLYLILMHGLALAVVVAPLNMSWAVRLAIAVLIVISFIWQWRRTGKKDPARIWRLVWEADGDWYLWRNDTTEFVGQLRPDSYVSPLLVILRFQLAHGGSCSVVILPDMLDKQSFRRLRVRLYQARLADATEDSAV